MQKVLIMSTAKYGLRSEAFGWTCEDGARVHDARGGAVTAHEEIGRVPGVYEFYSYAAPLLALGDGWALLAPPEEEDDGTWTWWFTKTSPTSGDTKGPAK